jgi:cell division protein FtsX
MSIIELVGGRSYFIYWPLVIQWIFYTSIASLLAAGVLYGLPYILPLDSLPAPVSSILSEFYIFFGDNLVYSFFVAVVLGMMSSFVASWKYIHKTIG